MPLTSKTSHLLKTLIMAGALSTAFFSQSFAETPAAPVPMQIKQAPGYYRMQLGNYEITAIYDGYVMIEKQVLTGKSAEAIDQQLSTYVVNSDKGLQTAVNTYLINTGNGLILLDTGAGSCFGNTLGHIENNMQQSGYKADQVSAVLLTHLHGDHVCGLLKEGHPRFQNATVYVAKAEADFWLNEDNAKNAPPELQAMFQSIHNAVKPYQDNKRFQTFDDKIPELEQVKIIPTPGHTPGHTAFGFESQGQTLVMWGDIIHNAAVQFDYPDVALVFDNNQDQAIATRKAILADMQQAGHWVAGSHLPFPGIGHVGKVHQQYRWLPIEYHADK